MLFMLLISKTQGQDGGIDNMLCLLVQPQRELQLNLKTNNTQNCQKIELYGSLTTKDLKQPHSSRFGRKGRDAERNREAQKGMKAGTGGPSSTCGGQKMGGIPQGRAIPVPVQTTRPRVPVPGR